jgi:hypothetical protein
MEQEHIDNLIEKHKSHLTENGVEASLAQYHDALDSLNQEKTRLSTAYQKGYLTEGDLDIRMKGIKEGELYYQGEIDRIKGEVDHLEEAIDALECIRQHNQLELVCALEVKTYKAGASEAMCRPDCGRQRRHLCHRQHWQIY